jgi:hypothetical protein
MSTQETAIITIEAVKEGLSIARFVNREELFKPEVIDPILDAYEDQVRSIVLADVSTPKGRKERISLAAAVCSAKTAYDKERETFLKDLRETVTTTNKTAGKVWDRLESLQKDIRQPVTDLDNAEKARVTKLEAELAEIIGAGTYTTAQWQTINVEAMRDRLHEIETTATDWQEYEQRAKLAIQTTAAQILAAIAQREKYDAEQAELARLRKEAAERTAKEEQERQERDRKEREEAIAKRAREESEAKAERDRLAAEAKAKAESERIEREKQEAIARAAKAEADAKAAAEKAEADRKAAEFKAEQDRIAAEAKAKADQEAAIEAERARVAKEQADKAAADAKRASHAKHRAKVIGAAIKALEEGGIGHIEAMTAVELIAEGKIPNVSIQF